MTFEEALAAPGRKVQVAGAVVKEGKRVLMIYRLGSDGAKQLAAHQLPEGEHAARMAEFTTRGLETAETDWHCDFIWLIDGNGVEVYDSKRTVFVAAGDRATLVDGKTVARADIATVMTYASDDYIHRGVKAELRSGTEVELVPEISLSAMSDPAYTRNELLMETGWTSTIGVAIATWAGASFSDGI